MPAKPIRIAFGHKARSGKDTSAEYVAGKYNAQVLRFASALYNITTSIQTILGRPIAKDRKLLTTIGEALKLVYGPDVWLKVVDTDIRFLDNVVVCDLRFPAEAEMLRSHGFILVNLTRADGVTDNEFSTHISETAMDGYNYDEYITAASVAELKTKIDAVIKKHFY